MSSLAHRSVLLLVLLACGCGPSLRSLHEGARYFERCYATDLLPSVPAEQKLACWDRWLAHYAQDQPPERVTYARLRQVAIAQGEELPPLRGLASPAPAAPAAAPSAPTAEAPRTEPGLEGPCGAPCLADWRRCARRCPQDDEACLRTCQEAAGMCVRACP